MSAVADQGDGNKPSTSGTSCGTSAPARPTAMELEAYKSLVSLLNAEEAAFWSRNNLLFAVHGALLAATAGILGNTDKVLAPGANERSAWLLFTSLVLLSLFGLAMAVAWLFMVARGKRIADTITGALKNIEQKLVEADGVALPNHFHAFRIFGAELARPGETDKIDGVTIQRPPMGRVVAFLAGVRLADTWLWVGAALVALWLLIFGGLLHFRANGHATPPLASETKATPVQVDAVAQAASAANAAALSAAEAASAAGRAALAAERAASAAAQRTRRGKR